MPAIRITHIHDLFDAVGRELDIVEMGRLDQRLHDGATARPIVSVVGVVRAWARNALRR